MPRGGGGCRGACGGGLGVLAVLLAGLAGAGEAYSLMTWVSTQRSPAHSSRPGPMSPDHPQTPQYMSRLTNSMSISGSGRFPYATLSFCPLPHDRQKRTGPGFFDT